MQMASAYGHLAQTFYDLDKPLPQPDAFEFYRDQVRRVAGPVLEPMCGSGRFLLPLLAEGVDIEGLDTSTVMLAACRERGRSLGLQPKLHASSLDAWSGERRFELVFIPNGSFCLLTECATIERSLIQMYNALRPGGRLLLELERLRPEPPQLSGTWGGRWVTCSDGSKIVLSWLGQYSGRADVTSSVHRYEHVVGGRVVEVEYEDFDVKSYELEEARSLLQGAGFAAIQAYKPYTESAPDDHDEAWVFSCVRPE
jgi:SAM-dependent methyltransferase